MMEFFSAVREYQFMQYALLACLLASLGCGVIGTYVVVKRISFLTGGIAHTILAGVGIAYFLESSPIAGAVIAALITAILIGWIKLRWRQDEDVLIAAFWSVGMAIGIIFISLTPGYNTDLMSYLFGNILLVTSHDILLMAILDIVIIATVFAFYKQFLAAAFDEEFARLRGINIEAYYILLLCMIALTIVLLIQIVGLILVMALLILPAASAVQFSNSIPRMMVIAVVLSAFITTSGLMLSYQLDLPSGATIIVIAGFVYFLSIVSKRIRSA
jgi:zinc transport system permease protein